MQGMTLDLSTNNFSPHNLISINHITRANDPSLTRIIYSYKKKKESFILQLLGFLFYFIFYIDF